LVPVHCTRLTRKFANTATNANAGGSNSYGTCITITYKGVLLCVGGYQAFGEYDVSLFSGLNAKSVATSAEAACVIRTDSTVTCVGINTHGQLGAETSTTPINDINSRVQLKTGLIADSLSKGVYHFCVKYTNGQMSCWGYNNAGQLGQGDTADRGSSAGSMGNNLALIALGTGLAVKQLFSGQYHNCVILDDHSVKCFGDNGNGQLGIENTVYMGSASNQMGDNLPSVNLGSNGYAVSLSLGNFHSCALLNTSLVKCWGYGAYGQLGIDSSTDLGSASGSMGDHLPYKKGP
jgi:alpha-tubulin suppressor-like RCC1 family protein